MPHAQVQVHRTRVDRGHCTTGVNLLTIAIAVIIITDQLQVLVCRQGVSYQTLCGVCRLACWHADLANRDDAFGVVGLSDGRGAICRCSVVASGTSKPVTWRQPWNVHLQQNNSSGTLGNARAQLWRALPKPPRLHV